jgi:hypothetical protein
MRFQIHTAGYVALALTAICLSATAAPLCANDKRIQNDDGGVLLVSDGSIPNGPCFRISGKITAPDFFDTFKRITDDSGSRYWSGTTEVTEFPDRIDLIFVIYDEPCSDKLGDTTPRIYMTREMMSSLHLYLYWKRGVELRPIENAKHKHSGIEAIPPYATDLAQELPERLLWSYDFAVPSGGVPLSDSLVLILRTPDGHMAARVAARP